MWLHREAMWRSVFEAGHRDGRKKKKKKREFSSRFAFRLMQEVGIAGMPRTLTELEQMLISFSRQHPEFEDEARSLLFFATDLVEKGIAGELDAIRQALTELEKIKRQAGVLV